MPQAHKTHVHICYRVGDWKSPPFYAFILHVQIENLTETNVGFLGGFFCTFSH